VASVDIGEHRSVELKIQLVFNREPESLWLFKLCQNVDLLIVRWEDRGESIVRSSSVESVLFSDAPFFESINPAGDFQAYIRNRSVIIEMVAKSSREET
jgi:hypothetical protein